MRRQGIGIETKTRRLKGSSPEDIGMKELKRCPNAERGKRRHFAASLKKKGGEKNQPDNEKIQNNTALVTGESLFVVRKTQTSIWVKEGTFSRRPGKKDGLLEQDAILAKREYSRRNGVQGTQVRTFSRRLGGGFC